MCGIAGFQGAFSEALLKQMNQVIAHRGPDDAALYVDPDRGIGLAHRRLSIIDLSSAGQQPMWDSTETCIISYNGEIYNFLELRKELESAGYLFRSHSDTEVLLNLYLRDGEAMLAKLNGIFAFAIYDTRQDILLLARDGVGTKPLYYAETEKGILFGSEIKSLLQYPELSRELDHRAVSYHLTYLWSPAPATVLKHVRKLPPGHAMILKNGTIARSWHYYDLPYDQAIDPLPFDEAVSQVRTALETAVERQMVADVPVGAFLSGGLDSTAICAFASQHTGNRRLQCFTIGFEESNQPWDGFSEDLPYARRAADHLGVDLHEITVGANMVDQLERMLYHLDEPQADPAPINALFISELARQHGIKVLLSGAGGDDIFTGYRRHYAISQECYWRWLPQSARRLLKNVTASLPTGSALGRRVQKAFQHADRPQNERICGYFHWLGQTTMLSLFQEDIREELSKDPFSAPLMKSLGNLPTGTHPLNRMLYLEGKHFLADHNLNYTDKTSMAAGVEVRVPFLDPDLIALAARLPVNYKQRGREGKYVFKQAMCGRLPSDLIFRPKTGFGAPLRQWLKGPLRGMVDDILSPEALKSRGIFSPEGVNHLRRMDSAGQCDGAYPIFALLCFELWCRQFIDATPGPNFGAHA